MVVSALDEAGGLFLNMNDSANNAQPKADACKIVNAISGSHSDVNNNAVASSVSVQIFLRRLT